MKKRFIIKLIFFIAILFALCNLFGCNNDESISFNITYSATEGGFVSGKTCQMISTGEDAEEIVAVPSEDYLFTGWSDGLTNQVRQDTNIKSNLNLTAYFEKVKFDVEYSTDEGGYIYGQANQVIETGNQTDLIIAKPMAGYIFVKWSDDYFAPERTDVVNESKKYVAEFEKIFNGMGTQNEPYQIVNRKNLQDMRYYPQSYFKLINNIDLQNVLYEPVFDASHRFSGFFDGSNYSIENLYIDSDIKYPSLFGFIDSHAKVENLNISDFSIRFQDMETSAIFAGAVASVSYGELKNITVSGEISAKNSLKHNTVVAGGLVGWSTGKIKDCHSDIVFNATDVFQSKNNLTLNVGGLVGFVENDVIDCSAKGSISLLSNVEHTDQVNINIGGMIGIYQYTENGSSYVKFTDSDTNVLISSNIMATCGGFFGNTRETVSIIAIENCFSSGDVNLKSNTKNIGSAGGFLGSFSVGAGSSIKNCYSTGNISANSANGFALDLLGYNYNLDVVNCFSTGNVNGGYDSNGFANSVSANLYNCYSNSKVDSVAYATGFIDSFSGTMKRCYSTGDIKGSMDITGFIWYANEVIEECYKSGKITAGQSGCGFIFVWDFNLLNCYSTSDIFMFSEEVPVVYGFVGITGGSVMNCYYSGAIFFENQPDYDYSYLALFASDIEGDIINCYVYSSDNLIKPIEKERDTELITDLKSYENVSEMFQLADRLNGKNFNVWLNGKDENQVPNTTPKFKDL